MNTKIKILKVKDSDISFINKSGEDYISLTDIAKYKNPEAPADIIKNWIRSKNTIELLGLWEKLHNPDFKLVEFDRFKQNAGYNHFVLSPQKWTNNTNAIGLLFKFVKERILILKEKQANRVKNFELIDWLIIK